MSAHAISTIEPLRPDYWLIVASVALLGLGLVMVCSASIAIAERASDQPFYYLLRQSIYIGVALLLSWVVVHTRLSLLEKAGPLLLLLGIAALTLLLVPGVGREINGSVRWVSLGPLNVQPSEFVKLAVMIYLADYLVRRSERVCTTFQGFLWPMLVLCGVATLLLQEPDYGAAVVLLTTAMGMLFLGGVRLWQFGLLLALAAVALAALAISSPYRLERLTTFLNPWADPFDTGFQLTQALIAFGRGEWLGVGLGGSVQKLFYLPEAHTDFLLAVLAEEMGLLGVTVVIGLFALLVWRAFAIAELAEAAGQRFGAFLAYGLGLWLALQSIVNMGVNMGMLPTKGLTLPLMSYGGSSIVTSCIAIALLLRIDYEAKGYAPREAAPAAADAPWKGGVDCVWSERASLGRDARVARIRAGRAERAS